MGFRCRWDCRRIPLAPLPSQLLLQRITSDYAVFSIRLSLGMVTRVWSAVGFGIIRGLQRLGCLTPSLFLVVSLLLFKSLPVGLLTTGMCFVFSDKWLLWTLYTAVYPTHKMLVASFFSPYMLLRVCSNRLQLLPTKMFRYVYFWGWKILYFAFF